jgi:O-antigen ligase
MNRLRIIEILDNSVYSIIWLTITIIPLYFNIFTFLSFDIEKILLFRTLVELALLAYLARSILAGGFIVRKNRILYPCLILLLITQILSTVFSEHRFISFYGTYWRKFGLVTYLHFYVFVFLAYNYIDTGKKRLSALLHSMAIVAAAISAYGILQVNNLDFLRWESSGYIFHDRATSTIGQPNYLGAYLLLIIPVTLYLILERKPIFRKSNIFLSILLMLQFFGLIVTYSRAAWLGLVILAAGWAIIHFYRSNKKIFSALIILFLTVLILMTALNIYRPYGSVGNSPTGFKDRMSTFTNLISGSGSVRLQLTMAALDSIKKRPLLGYGLDVQPFEIFKYYRPESAIFSSINSYEDRFHNFIFDTLFTVGIIGLSGWILLFVFIYRRAYEIAKWNDSLCLLAKAVAYALTAYLFTDLFGFDTIAPFLLFWFYIALFFRLTDQEPANTQKIDFEIRNYLKYILSTTLVLSFALIALLLNLRPAMADHYYRRAIESLLKNKTFDAFDNYNKCILFDPGEDHYRSDLAVKMIPVVKSLKDNDVKKELLDIIKESATDSEEAKRTFESRLALANLYRESGLMKANDPGSINDDFALAGRLYKELENDASGFSKLYYEWGDLFFYKRNYAKALEMYYRAYLGYYVYNEQEINLEHRKMIMEEMTPVLGRIINAHIAIGQKKAALKFTEMGLEISPDNGMIKGSREYLLNLNKK